MLDTIWFTLLV